MQQILELCKQALGYMLYDRNKTMCMLQEVEWPNM